MRRCDSAHVTVHILSPPLLFPLKKKSLRRLRRTVAFTRFLIPSAGVAY